MFTFENTFYHAALVFIDNIRFKNININCTLYAGGFLLSYYCLLSRKIIVCPIFSENNKNTDFITFMYDDIVTQVLNIAFEMYPLCPHVVMGF